MIEQVLATRIRDRNATILETRMYLLARKHTILCILDKLDDFIIEGFECLCSTLNDLRILSVCH